MGMEIRYVVLAGLGVASCVDHSSICLLQPRILS